MLTGNITDFLMSSNYSFFEFGHMDAQPEVKSSVFSVVKVIRTEMRQQFNRLGFNILCFILVHSVIIIIYYIGTVKCQIFIEVI